MDYPFRGLIGLDFLFLWRRPRYVRRAVELARLPAAEGPAYERS